MPAAGIGYGDARMSDQPGLTGVVPFRFQCQRSGRCCTGGTGFVWVEEDELEGLARAAGQAPEAFASGHLRRVNDPATGRQRLSLREGPGHAGGSGDACSLLEGHNHCSVYEARPRHCRSFPFWDGVLTDPEAFERARSTCPGIAPEVDPERAARAFEALEALYAELEDELAVLAPRCELSGVCCRFEEVGHTLFATALEADHAVRLQPQAPPPAAEGRCPYHVGGLCTAREGRPLGCRTYFCDEPKREALEALHERTLARVRAIEREAGYPARYAPFPEQLAERGVGGTD